MKLRGIDFGKVWGASGVQGFFGEGYPWHKKLGPFAPNFDGMTFVAKTTTLSKRPGNMPLDEEYRPRELLPKCVWANPWKGIALNAVGLSGPGARVLLEDGRWQKRDRPFMLSFMSVESSVKDRVKEYYLFLAQLYAHIPDFHTPFGLQMNFSCPNTGVHHNMLIGEVAEVLGDVKDFEIPIIVKLAVTTPVETALEIAEIHGCDALCVSNTIPFGQLAHDINWKRLIGKESPLVTRGFSPGGLSGKPLHPIVKRWIKAFREHDRKTPINAGGGILCPRDAIDLLDAGANSVFIGSMAFLRPWNVQRTIRAVNNRKEESWID